MEKKRSRNPQISKNFKINQTMKTIPKHSLNILTLRLKLFNNLYKKQKSSNICIIMAIIIWSISTDISKQLLNWKMKEMNSWNKGPIWMRFNAIRKLRKNWKIMTLLLHLSLRYIFRILLNYKLIYITILCLRI